MDQLTLTKDQQAVVNAGNAAGDWAQKKTNIDYNPVSAVGVIGPKPVSPVPTPLGVGSSEKGLDLLNTAKTKETKLTAPTPITAPTAAVPDAGKTRPVPTSTKVTLVNPATEQEITFDNADINRSSIQSYLGSGYKLATAAGAIPSWLSPANGGSVQTQTPDQIRIEKEASQAEADASKLRNFGTEMANDPALKGILDSIASVWDSRIKEAKDSATSQTAAMSTAGYRTGGLQYGGGAGSVAAGIISAAERAGASRVDTLLAQKNSALAEARSAYESQQWDRYAKLVDISEKKLAESKKAVADLNKTMIEENQKRKDAARLGSLSTTVADFMRKGVTDPKLLINYVNSYGDGSSTGANLTAEELKKMTDTFGLDENKDIGSILKSITSNGDVPSQIIDAVGKAKNVTEAYKIAAPYLKDVQTLTGAPGEYEYYKKDAIAHGQVPVDFNTYQTMDANRKARIAAAGVAGDKILSVSDAQALGVPYGTTQSQAFGKAVTGKPTEEQSKARQFAVAAGNANNDLSAPDAYTPGMWELQAGGHLPNVLKTSARQEFEQASRAFVNAVLRRESGASITDSEFVNKSKELIPQVGDSQAVVEQKSRARAAAVESIKEAGGGIPTTSSSLLNGEAGAKDSVIKYGSSNPTQQQHIKTLATEVQPELGRPYTYAEIKQVLNIP